MLVGEPPSIPVIDKEQQKRGEHDLFEAVRQPLVEGVGVGQQVGGGVCQALGATDGQHNGATLPVQADDVWHIPCTQGQHSSEPAAHVEQYCPVSHQL